MKYLYLNWKRSYFFILLAILLLGGALVVWATAPTTPASAPDLINASDTGTYNDDDITNDDTPTLTAVCTETGTTLTPYIEYIDPEFMLGTKFPLSDFAEGCLATGTKDITLDLSSLPDGSVWVLDITYTETNASLEESGQSPDLRFTLDKEDPAQPTIDTPVEGNNIVDDTEEGDVLVTGTAEANSTVTVTFDDGSNPVVTATVTADGDGDYTLLGSEVDISGLDDGTIDIDVTATDLAGNTGPAKTQTITHTDVDTSPSQPTTAPDMQTASDTGSSSTDNITNDSTPSFDLACTAGNTVRIYYSDSGGPWSSVDSGACPGGGVLTLTPPAPLSDTTVRSYYTEDNGDESGPSPILEWTLDTAAAAPVVTTPIEDDDYVNAEEDDDVVVYGTSEGSASVTVTFDDGSNPTIEATVTASADGEWTLLPSDTVDITGLDETSIDVTAVQTDLAGNTSASSAAEAFTYDATAPAAPTVLWPTTGGHSGTAARAYGTCETGTTVSVNGNGLSTSPATGTCSGGVFNIALTFDSGEVGTDQTLVIFQEDTAGNQSSSVTVSGLTLNSNIGAGSVIVVESNDFDQDGGNSLCDFGEAILNANDDSQTVTDCLAGSGDDIIVFNVGTGTQTLSVSEGITSIEDTVIIDGTTQPGGATCGESGDEDLDTRNLLISIDVNEVTTSNLRFFDGSENSVVRGLSFSDSVDDAISIAVDNVTVECNHLGVNAAGTAIVGVGVSGGVSLGGAVTSTDGAVVGGSDINDGNVIAGFTSDSTGGIEVEYASNVTIQNNRIGVNIDGSSALSDAASTEEGINICGDNDSTNGSSNINILDNIIGGTGTGIYISDCTPTARTLSDITIQGNHIGVDRAGTTALDTEAHYGINVTASVVTVDDLTIGGDTAAERNIIGGHQDTNGAGIVLFNSSGSNTTIQGNYIGIGADGSTVISNGNATNGIGGIYSVGPGSNVTIGGSNEGEGNVIAGNLGNIAANFSSGIYLNSASTASIKGNIIGTDATQTTSIGNGTLDGIFIVGGTGVTIGGPGEYEHNVIVGHDTAGAGVFSTGSSAVFALNTNDLTIQGNYMGVTSTGTAMANVAGIMNAVSGTDISNHLLGGSIEGEGNIIKNTDSFGIVVADIAGSVDNVTILGNSIDHNHALSTLGIDLSGTGATLFGPNTNDAGDVDDIDAGANQLLNHPEIGSVATDSVNQTATVTYTLDVPAGDYRIEYFDNTDGEAEGETFLTAQDITHSGSGSESFSKTISTANVASLTALTMTATEIDNALGATDLAKYGSTSEYSAVKTGSEITVEEPGGGGGGGSTDDDEAECTLVADPSIITEPGQSVELNWGSNFIEGQVNKGKLKQGNTTLYNLTANDNVGSFVVEPTGTTTYNIQNMRGDFVQGRADCETTVTLIEPINIIVGCMDETALNYNPNATVAGTCNYPPEDDDILGCTNTTALNYNSEATYDDGSCEFEEPIITGCTDFFADNYVEGAEYDDGSCTYTEVEEGSGNGEGGSGEGGSGNGDGGKAGALAFTTSLTAAELRSLQLIAAIAVAATLPTLLPRIWNLLLAFLGYRKKQRDWGTVYNADTKQPLDPAYVTLTNEAGDEVATAITDPDGRYGFVVDPGTYYLKAEKTNFIFPSKKLAGKQKDELYTNLYFGEAITIKEHGEVITENIPMDPTQADWNEQEKARMGKSIFQFFSKYDKLILRVINSLFWVGLVLSIVLLVLYPVTWNIVVFALYMFILLLMILGLSPTHSGKVTLDNEPLPFAIVRIYNAALNKEVAHKITNEYGQYYALVPKGEYYLTVEEKNPDGFYTHVHTSDAFIPRRGVVNGDIAV